MERPGSLALKIKDLTILIFKADIIVLHQAVTFESLNTLMIPKHLAAPASLSKIIYFRENQLYARS